MSNQVGKILVLAVANIYAHIDGKGRRFRPREIVQVSRRIESRSAGRLVYIAFCFRRNGRPGRNFSGTPWLQSTPYSQHASVPAVGIYITRKAKLVNQSVQGENAYSLLTPAVEIDAADAPLLLVEADVVEAFEAGAIDSPHSMVGHQEVLLPAHEDVLLVVQVLNVHGSLPGVLSVRAECREFVPVIEIDLFVRTPAVVLREEIVLGPDDLTLKVCC